MKAMYNRCNPHFDEGILPVCRKTHNILCIVKTSLFVVTSLLILLPATSLAVAPKYETAYACEGKTLTIECEQGDLINLIRANYGRFSITICNDHGNVEWSVNCMSPKSLRVLHSKCTHKQNCSVLASTNMFGDPCLGTHKYLEAHYQCISAAQTSTTTNRPSPPWLLTSTPSTSIGTGDNGLGVPIVGGGGTSVSTNLLGHLPTISPKLGSNANYHHDLTSIHFHNKPPPPPLTPTSTNSGGGEIHLAGGRPPAIGNDNPNITNTITGNVKAHRPIGVLPRPSSNNQDTKNYNALNIADNNSVLMSSGGLNISLFQPTQLRPTIIKNNTAIKDDSNNKNQHGGAGINDSNIYNNNINGISLDTTQSSVLDNSHSNQNYHNTNNYNGNTNNIIRTNYNEIDGGGDNYFFCGPTTARNLFWNVTRVGEVNVQPCPGGATGIAKWRCVLLPRSLLNSNLRQSGVFRSSDNNNNNSNDSMNSAIANASSDCEKGALANNCDLNNEKYYQPTWHPMTPDLTQCRSLWLNSLEIGVNQRDSSLISIANDLSQVTSSKTLYGGDMLVTTKIIQTMSEKMSYDVETFPDQRQREAIISELLHGVVKTGSNLLDESQHLSWLDLSFEDQMRVATSLLTGLEDNAFLLADTIIRERNVMQKVKNILLSVRVLETKNIVSNEIFPDGKLEQWSVSDDRIELPRGALIENSEGGLVRIVFVAFDRLESILKPSNENLDFKFSRNYVQSNVMNDTFALKRVQILNSKVISASLGKGRHIQLPQPIKLILRHLKTENVSSPTCVYWNYIDHAWSADGCYLESTNRTHSICMCNHLTNFAILMDVIDERSSSLLSMIDSNMRILIYISIAICIIFIVIAILTLKLFNGVFIKSTRNSIYKNIYICLFMIEILFLFGIEQSETSLLCGFTTIFLHCFVLSAIAWICFEGFQSYVTLTTDDMLLEVENSTKVIGYYLLSYGLSLTIVAISLVIDPDTYTQSDFCVLMEANALFYTTFFAPIILFLLGAIGYTILACFIMHKKNKSTIKNKEHTRLTNVRFDIRCSILFLMALLADWIFAYLYLRKAKLEDESSNTPGYMFITFNSLFGIYIFIFHCVQNEKIRREYRKYVRQNSWLPKCLRCSKTSSISSSSSHGHHHHYGGSTTATSNKKSPIGMSSVVDPAEENIIAAATSGSIAGTPSGNVASKFVSGEGAILTGTLQQAKTNSMMGGSIQGISPGHIILERASGGSLRTPSVGHTSPTSSVGSSHLIFNSNQNEPQVNMNWSYHQQPEYYAAKRPGSESKNFNTYDDKFLYYDSKSKRIKSGYPMSTAPRNISASTVSGVSGSSTMLDPQLQQHEFFYWTEKNNQKRMNGDIKSQKSDTKHTFYPSYKKTTTMTKLHYPEDTPTTSSDAAIGLPLEDNPHRKYYHHHRYPKQLSSDDGDSSTHHLMQGNQTVNIAGVSIGLLDPGDGSLSSHPSDCFPTDLQSYHQNYRHKHSSEIVDCSSYYNQGETSADEPVYEEILNSRMSEICDENEDNAFQINRNKKIDVDDKDEEDNDENDDVENMIMEEEKYNRIRRMMANKDESFKRQRFLRQDKNLPIGFTLPGSSYNYQQHGQNIVIGKNLTHDRDDIGASSINSNSSSRNGPPVQPIHHHQRTYHQQSLQSQSQPAQQQQYPVGRNISAMLDENNTVVCYLEPLPK